MQFNSSDDLRVDPAEGQRGFSLIEVMVAVGISGFLILLANQMLSDVNKWMSDISVDADLVELSQKISSRISCEKTFGTLGISAGINPVPTQQVQLYDKNGREIFSSHTLGGAFAAYKKISGDWLVDSTWTGQSFSVRVAKLNGKSDGWAKDPVTKTTLNFTAPKNTLFGDRPSFVPLCPERITGSVLLRRFHTTSGEINRLLGKPNPGNLIDLLGRSHPTGVPENFYDASKMLLTPLTFPHGCHEFCRKPGNNYTSGIMIGIGDWSSTINSAGDLVNTNYPVGQSVVVCECYL
jgi:prepilin-type N-terminal cleavage/methylation domain-containing protein